MSEQTYTIYLIKDHRMKPYVGVTSKTPKERLRKHKTCARSGEDSHLYRAMRKYGTDKFKVIPLDTAPTKEKAFELEKKWIAHLGTFDDWGYNMTPGGRGAAAGEDHMFYGQNRDVSWREISNYNEPEVQKAFNMKSEGIAVTRICEEIGISRQTFYNWSKEGRLTDGKPWQEVLGGGIGKGNSTKLSRQQASEVKWLALNSALTQKEIGRKYEVSNDTVSQIKNEHTWSDLEPQKPKNHA